MKDFKTEIKIDRGNVYCRDIDSDSDSDPDFPGEVFETLVWNSSNPFDQKKIYEALRRGLAEVDKRFGEEFDKITTYRGDYSG